MYGDILAYHETFKESENNNTTTYEQRAAELKSRLKRSHIIRMGSNKKPIKVQETIKVVFGIKCLENKAYVAKKNKVLVKPLKEMQRIMIYMTYAGLTLMFQRQ